MYLVKHSHTINYQGFWLIYVEFDWPIRLIFVWTSKLPYVMNYLRFIFTPRNRISIWFEKWSANGRIQHFPNNDQGPPPVLYVKWPRIWITKNFSSRSWIALSSICFRVTASWDFKVFSFLIVILSHIHS